MKLKAVCNVIPFETEKISPRVGLEVATTRSEGQRLTHLATGSPRKITRNRLLAIHFPTSDYIALPDCNFCEAVSFAFSCKVYD